MARPTLAAENDLVLALVHLGYKRAAAERAVVRVARQMPEAEFAEQLKASLKVLSRV